jgi:release factor glutamine methyltransferase
VSADTWTLQQLLTWCTDDFRKRGIPSPRLDAELLVGHALGIDRVRIYLDFERPLTPEERASIRALVERRRRREPVAYILGERAFFGRMFSVTPSVLVPRPDSETLIERALERIPKDEPQRILDVGTGSGCLGLTLAAERALAHVTLVDLSDDALRVALLNAERLSLTERVTTCRSDLFANVVTPSAGFDLIVSNPPYIPTVDLAGLMPDVREHEPHLALDGGPDGLRCVRALIKGASRQLKAGGVLLLEIGVGQADACLELLNEAAFTGVCAHKDLGRIPRVVEGCRA